VFEPPLARTAHDEQVAGGRREIARGPAPRGADEERPSSSERDDRDQRVVEVAELTIGVERDAVVTVAVVVEADGAEGRVVVRSQRVGDLNEDRMGEWVADAEPAREAWIVDHPVVHAPPPAPPRHLLDELVEEGVGTADPAAAHVDPRHRVECDSLRGHPLVDLEGTRPEQRTLVRDHESTLANARSCHQPQGPSDGNRFTDVTDRDGDHDGVPTVEGPSTSPEQRLDDPNASAPTEERAGALAAFRSREFVRFFGAGAISNTGTWMQSITVPFVIDQLTHSTALVGVSAFCAYFPATIVAPLAGSLADRYDRRAVLIWAQVLQAAVAVALWALWSTGAATAPLILVIVVIGGFGTGITISVWQSFVPQLVPRAALLSAVRLNSMQFTMARAVGPALAGLVLATLGPSFAFACNAVSFLFVIGALLMITPRPPEKVDDHAGVARHFLEGVRYMREREVLAVAILMMTLVVLLGVSMVQLVEPFARHVLDVGAGVYGLLTGGYGAGAVVGGMFMVWFGDSYRRSALAGLGLATMVAGVLLLGLAPVWAVAFGGLFLIGAAQVFTSTSCNTAIQINVDEEYRGRASSVYMMAFFAAAPIGALVGGFLGEVVGLRATIAGSGVLLAGLTAWALVRYRRLRALDESMPIFDHVIAPAGAAVDSPAAASAAVPIDVEPFDRPRTT
jgi:MFS family permease